MSKLKSNVVISGVVVSSLNQERERFDSMGIGEFGQRSQGQRVQVDTTQPVAFSNRRK
jgi:hypothetical protein